MAANTKATLTLDARTDSRPCAPDTIEVVLVDDDPDHLELLATAFRSETLESGAPAFNVHPFSDATAALAAIPPRAPLAIVSDYSMPGGTGIDWLRDYIHADAGPVLLLTGHGDERVAADAFRAGASDYLSKFEVLEDPRTLHRAVREAVRRYRLEKQNRTLTQELRVSNSSLEAKHANLQQLTRSLTHDLQTPLVGLTGSIDVLRSHLGEKADATTRHWLGRLEGAALRAIAMLDDLMVYAKAGGDTVQLGPVDLDRVVRETVEDLGGTALVRGVNVHVTASQLYVNADPLGLGRILSNLVGNSIKYCEAQEGAAVNVAATMQDGRVRVEVTDNGPGIPPEQLENVFLPFKRLSNDKPGTGLGLAIARRYAEAFGGTLRLESDGKSGTRAVLELAAAAPQKASAA